MAYISHREQVLLLGGRLFKRTSSHLSRLEWHISLAKFSQTFIISGNLFDKDHHVRYLGLTQALTIRSRSLYSLASRLQWVSSRDHPLFQTIFLHSPFAYWWPLRTIFLISSERLKISATCRRSATMLHSSKGEGSLLSFNIRVARSTMVWQYLPI